MALVTYNEDVFLYKVGDSTIISLPIPILINSAAPVTVNLVQPDFPPAVASISTPSLDVVLPPGKN